MKRLAPLAALLLAPLAASAEDGIAIYYSRCDRCHGPEGRGQAVFEVPVLVQSSLTAEQMEEVVADGRGRMPAFKAKLGPKDIRAVVAFVKGGFKR